MTSPTPTPPPLPPPRCDASEIAAMLAAVAQPGSHLLVNRYFDDMPGCVFFVTASLWACSLWGRVGRLEWTMHSKAPDGRTWDFGCQRDWTGTGEVIDPLDLLSHQQRVALEHRLITAAAMPEAEPLSDEQALMSILPKEQMTTTTKCRSEH